MNSDDRQEVTELLTGIDRELPPSSCETSEELMVAIYPRLRRLAQKYLAGERPGHTLMPTAIVHEAYLRLVDQDRVDWQGRTHFFAVSARAMRRVLIDHARSKGREKRGGEWQRVSLVEDRQGDGEGRGSSPDGGGGPANWQSDLANLDMEQFMTVHAALERLAKLDPRQAQILELRFFAGLTVQEVADALGVSKRTVEGDWTHARAWFQRELEHGGTPP